MSGCKIKRSYADNGLPWWLSGKESTYQCRRWGSLLGSGRYPGGIPGRYSSLEEESSILAWETPWTEEPGGAQVMGSKSQGHNLAIKSRINALNGEGNGTPLQYSCLENPMDGGAW